MKILKLALRPFGCFDNLNLDFTGEKNFHLLYGNNEAGKSTVLRALINLFYGIPGISDAYLYEPSKLRIAACIRRSDQKELSFLRRKGRDNTILDENNSPLPDNVLQDYLGGVTKELFVTMFALNHEMLRRGGQSLLSAADDAGTSIFAAGTGISELRDLFTALETEAGNLFRPSASKPAINNLIRQFMDARKEILSNSLQPNTWLETEGFLKKKEKEIATCRLKLQEAQSLKTRLERAQYVLPLLAKLRELREEFKELGIYVELPASAGQERVLAKQNLQHAEDNFNKTNIEIEELQRQMESIHVSEELLAQASTIDYLHKGVDHYRSAYRDLPIVSATIQELEAESRQILRKLDTTLPLEEAEKLNLPEEKTELIRKLAKDWPILQVRLSSIINNIEDKKRELEKIEQQIQECGMERNARELQLLVVSVQKRGDLERDLESTLDKAKKIEEEALIRLRGLGIASAGIEDLEGIPVPLSESIDRFAGAFAALDEDLRLLQVRLEDIERRNLEILGELEKLKLLGDIPTRDEVENARFRRQEGWRLIKAWLNGERNTEQEKVFDQETPIMDAYEKSVVFADTVADRLYSYANYVANKASLLSEQKTNETKMALLKLEIENLEEKKRTLSDEWIQLWQPTGITPLSPEEMCSWLNRFRENLKPAEDYRDCRRKEKSLKEVIEECCRKLNQGLVDLEEHVVEDTNLASLLERCTKLITNIRENEMNRSTLNNSLKEGNVELQNIERKKSELEKNIDLWKKEWAEAMRSIQLADDAIPEQAESKLRNLDELFNKLDRIPREKSRVMSMKKTVDQFTQSVSGLIYKKAHDTPELPPDQVVEELNARLVKAKEGLSKLNTIEEELNKKVESLKKYQEMKALASRELDYLMKRASCTDLIELENAERKSDKARSIIKEISDTESQLLEIGTGLTIAGLAEEIKEVDRDKLPAQITDTKQEVDELNIELESLKEDIGALKNKLDAMNKGSYAVDAAEKAQGLLAQMRSATEQYICLRLAVSILRKQIETFREEKQGPVIERANEIFPRLTMGSFSALKVDFDANDKPVLLGVRPFGKEVDVTGMSDGVLDQLYLTLRLAHIEYYVENSEPIPLILDDILINFDDDRARATLEVLSDLSKKIQILFFTHHSRILELSKTIETLCPNEHSLIEAVS